MLDETIADRYSQAILSLAVEKDRVNSFLVELRLIAQLMERFPVTSRILKSPRMGPEQKKIAIKDLLGKRISKEVLHFLFLLVDKGREEYLGQVIKSYHKKVEQMKNAQEGEAVFAQSPSKEVLQELIKNLSDARGKDIGLKIKIDPGILGGFKVILKDDVIDLSIRGQLEKMGRRLYKARISGPGG